MKNKNLLLGFLCLAVTLGAAFLTLDFYAASSNADRQHQYNTYATSGYEQQQPIRLTVYLPQEGPLHTSLAPALQKELSNQAFISQVEFVEELPSPPHNPLLRVEVSPRRLLWLPFRGKTDLNCQTFYSSLGDLSLLEKDVIRFETPGILYKGELEMQDSTWGLLSLPAYRNHIARIIAAEIVSSLERALF